MKAIGHTSSGKPVYAAFQLHRSFADWTANDHNDAADVHRDVARTDIKTNVSMHKNSAALHEEEAQRIYRLVGKLGIAAKKSGRHHATRTARKSSAQLNREIAEALAKKPRSAHAVQKRIAYRIKLTPSEMRAVEFARGRYEWPDMLAAHAAEDGSIAFTESEMWQWTDDVDADTAGGHSPFPLASDALAEKLQRFYDERI